MTTAFYSLSWTLVVCMAVGMAAAQDASAPAAASPPTAAGTAPPSGGTAKPAPRSNAQLDAGEPRATMAPAVDHTAARDVSDTTVAPAGDHPATRGAPKTLAGDQPAATATPGAVTTPAVRGAPRTAAAAGSTPAGQKAGAHDRLDLGAATVTGDREQPKVMYIVPWKKSDIGDLSGKPMNSLLDEALSPVDRDEFKREVAYYDAVNADTSQNGARNSAKQGEK